MMILRLDWGKRQAATLPYMYTFVSFRTATDPNICITTLYNSENRLLNVDFGRDALLVKLVEEKLECMRPKRGRRDTKEHENETLCGILYFSLPPREVPREVT